MATFEELHRRNLKRPPERWVCLKCGAAPCINCSFQLFPNWSAPGIRNEKVTYFICDHMIDTIDEDGDQNKDFCPCMDQKFGCVYFIEQLENPEIDPMSIYLSNCK